MKKTLCLTIALALNLLGDSSEARGAAENNTSDLDGKIAQLSRQGTNVRDVIRLLGEPESYAWGPKIFTKENLPGTYLMLYPQGVRVGINGGRVWEIRSEGPGPGFTWGGKLRLGSSLDEVLQVLGPPSKTLTGEPLAFAAGVLYKDFDGKKGECYYSRPEQNIRLFLRDYKVCALYVPLESDEGGGDDGENFMTVKPIRRVEAFQDVRFKDMSKLDLSAKPELPAMLNFNQKSVWPKEMSADAARLLSSAMNPGLGVRKLHQDGLTGNGVKVAIIDQPLYQDHPEFAGKIAAYQDVGCQSETSMHGPAVASLLVGAKCGVAPGAGLYYAAAPSWTADTAYQAKALDWIVEQNEKLPATGKIRVVSVSAAPSGAGSPFKKNTEMWDAACERAEKACILVLDCTGHHGFVGPCYYDAGAPEDVTRCRPGFPGMPKMSLRADWLLVPCSPRTTAEEYVNGQCEYQYCGRGGLSWGIPYCAGVLALGWQVRPDITGPQMRELLFASAYTTPEGAKIINPPAFIEAVKRFAASTK